MVSLRTEDRPVDAPTPILRKVNDNTFKVSAVNDCNSIVPVAEVAGPSWNEIAAPKEEREKNTGATWKITITITGGSYVNSALLARSLPLRVLGTGLAVTGELTTWASAGSGRQR